VPVLVGVVVLVAVVEWAIMRILTRRLARLRADREVLVHGPGHELRAAQARGATAIWTLWMGAWPWPARARGRPLKPRERRSWVAHCCSEAAPGGHSPVAPPAPSKGRASKGRLNDVSQTRTLEAAGCGCSDCRLPRILGRRPTRGRTRS
jgi:hypothetical protein